jgi:hypothetical protein
MATDPLFVLIPQEGSSAEALERFIADVLYQGGVWNTPRVSDGISTWRVDEHGATRVRLAGKIYEISQKLRPFCLDLELDEERPEQVHWTLSFDGRVTLTGTAEVQDGLLVTGSVREGVHRGNT